MKSPPSSKKGNRQGTPRRLRILFDTRAGRQIAAGPSSASLARVTKDGEMFNWQPVIDLFVADRRLTVTIEIAGVKIYDVTLRVSKSYMIISGVRCPPASYRAERCIYHTMELAYGAFMRRIEFPVTVMPRELKYSDNNGILTITMPVKDARSLPGD